MKEPDNMIRMELSEVLIKKPDKIVLSDLRDKTHIYRKTVIQKYYKNDALIYQVERFTDKQAFHENIEPDMLVDVVLDTFPECYKQVNIFSEDGDVDFKVTKKGKLLSNAHKGTAKLQKKNLTHNRKKNYILEEGMVIPPLVDLGVFTKDGKVVNSMYDKYKQINRFIELVDDVIKNYPDKQEFNIIDFGCGKSYLTFILYYYLVELRGINVSMTGLDLKEDVIARCNATAKKYNYGKLHFELGDINGYKTDKPVDMVVTLHACDTATDYALYNAISWNAGIILSVPCCQHEINGQIESSDYSILTKYGIIKERISALMTDAIRGNVLEYCGYDTQIIEFIDIAHSPKNILIRAVRRGTGRTIDTDFVAGGITDCAGKTSEAGYKNDRRQKAWDEAERLCKEFHIKQTLMELVKEEVTGKEVD